MEKAEFLQSILSGYEHVRYLEIGVEEGHTFRRLNASQKTAVDPHFLFDYKAYGEQEPTATLHQVTSDDYFQVHAANSQYDVIFIDGLHTFEQTLRDFINALSLLAKNGIIIIDDVMPTSYAASLASLQSVLALRARLGDEDLRWMGDVYKVIYFIASFMPFVDYRTTSGSHPQTVAWLRDTARQLDGDMTVEKISRLSFADIMLDSRCFNMTDADTILHLIEDVRARR